MALDLSDFERKMHLRPLTVEDVPQLLALSQLCFPGMEPSGAEHITSQIEIFPEGQMCIEVEGRLAASSSSLIVDFDDYSEWQDWKKVADNGFIRNHDSEGDTLYGIEIMVHPDFRGHKFSRRLYNARKDLVRRLNLSRILVGGRIPGFHKHADTLSPREYVEKVMEKAIFDPVLTAQIANGFVMKGLIPDYLPDDTESCGYATYLEWTNLEHRGPRRRRLRNETPVRIGVVQYQMRRISTFEEFRRQCEFFVDEGSDYKCDFLLFPELFTTQLLSLVEPCRMGMAARALSRFTPEYLDTFRGLAVEYNINLIGGSHLTVEDEHLYNISYLFRRDGTIGKQYKLHCTPNERRWWGVNPGTHLEVFDTDCGKISIQICYDIEFPELARISTAKGARIIFVPSNTDTRQGYMRVRQCALARCIENHVYTVVSGCTGNLPFVDNAGIHFAQSAILTPVDFAFPRDGVASESTANVESLLIHDIDLELVRRHRQTGVVQNWKDRRTDLYHVRHLAGEAGMIDI